MRGLVALSLMAALVPTAPADAAQLAAPHIAIDWTMPDRFGIDANEDGRVDFPNTHAYAHNRIEGSCAPCSEPKFWVNLTASVEPNDQPLPVRLYKWTISSETWEGPLEYYRTEPELEVLLPEGDYEAALAMTLAIPWGKVTVHGGDMITVSDLLIVSIGDSYSSGEGNPEVRRSGSANPALWGDGATNLASEAHADAHRSTVAWPARVALAIELRDPRTSVTFISLAASGDRIDRGMIHARGQRPSQVAEISRIVGDRNVDLLLLQAGGNSVGFANFIRALVEADPLFDPVCYETMVEQAVAAVRDGDWSRTTRVRFELPWDWSCREDSRSGIRLPGLEGLPAAFDRLEQSLTAFDYGAVVLVGYPDPTGADSSGNQCREIVGDVTPPLRFHEVSRDEGRLGVTELLQPLNETLRTAAEAHGWLYVPGVAEAFAAGHGYCATWPDYGYPETFDEAPSFAGTALDFPDAWYRNPGRWGGAALTAGADISWYRTAGQSAVLQGPAAPFATSGTLHPNEIGHAAIAGLVLAALG